MTVDKLQGLHVTKWIESRKDWTPTTGNDVVSLIQRAFRWAVKRGHIRTSPVEIVEGKPRKQRRETVFTPVQWGEIRALVKDQQFGDLRIIDARADLLGDLGGSRRERAQIGLNLDFLP